MQDVVYKLKEMIATQTTSTMTEEQKYYVSGLADALELVEQAVAESLVVGRHYFVIMYRDGDPYLPYVEEMKLYRISQKSVSSYCFTRNLTAKSYSSNNPDLVLRSKKGLSQRVFFTREQAESAIKNS